MIYKNLPFVFFDTFFIRLNAQALADFVPVEKRRDLVETYEKARIKGVAYVKGRVSDSEEEV